MAFARRSVPGFGWGCCSFNFNFTTPIAPRGNASVARQPLVSPRFQGGALLRPPVVVGSSRLSLEQDVVGYVRHDWLSVLEGRHGAAVLHWKTCSTLRAISARLVGPAAFADAAGFFISALSHEASVDFSNRHGFQRAGKCVARAVQQVVASSVPEDLKHPVRSPCRERPISSCSRRSGFHTKRRP